MTRVFVCEYLCGGGARPAGANSWASSLFAEGRAMLTALLDDFSRIAGVEVATILDQRLRSQWTIDGPVQWIEAGQDEPAFRTAARRADWTLVIAPELDRILETRCRWVEEEGGKLLGPDLTAIVLTADKLALARQLRDRGVPTPETDLAANALPSFPPPYVLKHRFGAGSNDMLRLDGNPTASDLILADAERGGVMIIQPLVPGRAASVSFLIGRRRTHVLVPAAQHVSGDGRFRYLGGRLPLPERLAARARRIAQHAISAVPGLFGYVGVDIVLGPASDGSEDYVIEINPRLTTSYVGLRALAHDNLAHLMLRLAKGESVAKPRWRSGAVAFFADGRVKRS